MIFYQNFGSLHNFFAARFLYLFYFFFQVRNLLGKHRNVQLRTKNQVIQTLRLLQWRQSQRLQIAVDFGSLHGKSTRKFHQCVALFTLPHHKVVAFLRSQSEFIATRSKTHIGIVLTEQNTVFGTRSEHTVRLVDAFRYKVVNQHTDIGFVTAKHKRFLSGHTLMGIDTGNKSLPCRFLISGRSVHLSGKEQAFDELRFKRMAKLRRVEKVIFDGIAGTIDLRL